MAKTVGYNLAVGNMKKRRVAGRNSISKTKAEWLGAPKEERFTPPDVTDPRRAITRLERRVRNTRHDNDMYRIGGGAVGPVKSGYESGARVNPRISFVKRADGKIVPERRAQTFQKSNVPWRPELPVGKPGNPPPTSFRGPRGRMVSNPGYGQWKSTSLGYNAALSRQQSLQPSNPVIQEIKPVDTNPTERYPATVTSTYRTGAEQAFVKKPQPDPSPFNSKL